MESFCGIRIPLEIRPVFYELTVMKCEHYRLIIMRLNMPAAPALFLFSVAGLLCGCRSTPTREEPPAPADSPSEFSQSGTAAASPRWWEAFEHSALNDTVETALRENLELRAAIARFREARAVARRTTSDQLPDLDGEATFQRDGQ